VDNSELVSKCDVNINDFPLKFKHALCCLSLKEGQLFAVLHGTGKAIYALRQGSVDVKELEGDQWQGSRPAKRLISTTRDTENLTTVKNWNQVLQP
jgi:hypothetical protein